MLLDENFLKIVKEPIHTVWDAIGMDVIEENPKSPNDACIDACIDSDSIVTFAEDKDKVEARKVNDLIVKAIKKYGYNEVIEFLCKHIKLN